MVSHLIVVAAALAGTTVAMASTPIAERVQSAHPSMNLTGAHGFDFLVGEWRGHRRRINPASGNGWSSMEHAAAACGSVTIEETAGCALGLSISKHVVEAHVGVIDVEKNATNGASFVVTLPRVRVAVDIPN
jgi:hypothetical protein